MQIYKKNLSRLFPVLEKFNIICVFARDITFFPVDVTSCSMRNCIVMAALCAMLKIQAAMRRFLISFCNPCIANKLFHLAEYGKDRHYAKLVFSQHKKWPDGTVNFAARKTNRGKKIDSGRLSACQAPLFLRSMSVHSPLDVRSSSARCPLKVRYSFASGPLWLRFSFIANPSPVPYPSVSRTGPERRKSGEAPILERRMGGKRTDIERRSIEHRTEPERRSSEPRAETWRRVTEGIAEVRRGHSCGMKDAAAVPTRQIAPDGQLISCRKKHGGNTIHYKKENKTFKKEHSDIFIAMSANGTFFTKWP